MKLRHFIQGATAALIFMVGQAAPLAAGDTTMDLNPDWEYVADTVMGGVSEGQIAQTEVEGRDAVRLSGRVSLDNNGGFIQMAFDVAGGGVLDASVWEGIELDVWGQGAPYELRLRTDQLSRPWQSYQADLTVVPHWQTIRLAWSDFAPRKTDTVFDPARLRRVGVLAIGAEMQADIAVSGIRLYRSE